MYFSNFASFNQARQNSTHFNITVSCVNEDTISSGKIPIASFDEALEDIATHQEVKGPFVMSQQFVSLVQIIPYANISSISIGFVS